MNYGFVRVGAAVPEMRVAECQYNAGNIVEMIEKAEKLGIEFVVFPELSITAYTCGDLFHQEQLLNDAINQLKKILDRTANLHIVAILGLPLYVDNQLYNCGVAIQKGKILGVVPKTYIPGYSEFYEQRWFASGTNSVRESICLWGQEIPFGMDLLFEARDNKKLVFGIELCEDLWVPIPPSSSQALAGATLLFNLSASNEVIGKYEYRRKLIEQQSGRCIAGYVFSSAGIGESTTDVVFGGHALVAENGSLLKEGERFSFREQLIYTEIDIEKLGNDRCKNTSFKEGKRDKTFRKISFDWRPRETIGLLRTIDAHPFVPSSPEKRDERCHEIFSIQTVGLRKRLMHTNIKKAIIGVSGGLDSTLALLVIAKTFDDLGIPRENIEAITMPGFGTTGTTYSNAMELMKALGTNITEIDIKPACMQHFRDIQHDMNVHDLTFENVQARERTQILMDWATKKNGLVIGTGDLSELALGWCTYNGDHMSMYSVNCSIPKTLVRFLVQWAADHVALGNTKKVLYSILETPITPELLPPDETGKINQKTEDIIGPYELHDFFLYHMVRYGAPPKKILFLAERAFEGRYTSEVIRQWLIVYFKRFFSQQFKRSCLPDGPKVGTISLSPRGDWRMPSDAVANMWLKELE